MPREEDRFLEKPGVPQLFEDSAVIFPSYPTTAQLVNTLTEDCRTFIKASSTASTYLAFNPSFKTPSSFFVVLAV